MTSRFPLDPFARSKPPFSAASDDISVPPAGRWRLRDVLLVAAAGLVLTFLLAVVLFLPVLAHELDTLDAVVVAGVPETAASFFRRLTDLFLGLVVLAAAVSSFVLSLLLTSPPARPLLPARRRWSVGGALRQAGIRTAEVRNVRPL